MNEASTGKISLKKSFAKPGSPPRLSRDRMRAWFENPIVAGLSLVAIVLASYAPAIKAGYIWDDDFYVTENATLRSLDGLRGLVRFGGRAAILPAGAFHVLDRAASVGIRSSRLSRREYPPARHQRDPPLATAAPLAITRCVVCGLPVRGPPGRGRIGRLDHGAKECVKPVSGRRINT